MGDDHSRPRTAIVTIICDLETQQGEVKLSNCATFEFALALVRMGELMLEGQRRAAQAQQIVGAHGEAALTQHVLEQIRGKG